MSSHHILALVPKMEAQNRRLLYKRDSPISLERDHKRKEVFLGSPLNNKKDNPMPNKGSIKYDKYSLTAKNLKVAKMAPRRNFRRKALKILYESETNSIYLKENDNF